MKIIDSHMHIGNVGVYSCNVNMVLKCMSNFDVSFGVISNMSANEFDSNANKIPNSQNQIQINSETLTLCKKYPIKLKGLFWIRPNTECFDENIENYITENAFWFCGMKVHPKGSCLRFKKENYIDYLKMCERLDWPVCIHTEQDGYSNVEYVYEVAKQFPNIKFVMVHMELSTDHRNAIQLIEKLPNLFGDTTLVDLQTVQKAITYCGSNKILFGTDAPVFGESSYKRYDNYLQQLKLFFSQEEIENVFYQNAKNIFHLKEEF